MVLAEIVPVSRLQPAELSFRACADSLPDTQSPAAARV